MEEFNSSKPQTRFEDNFINLFKFYLEFSKHFKQEQGSLEANSRVVRQYVELLKIMCKLSGRFETEEISRIFDSYPNQLNGDLLESGNHPNKINPLTTQLIELLKKLANGENLIETAISISSKNEVSLLNRLFSVCIIQLYTLFESYLRDIFIEIASADPQSYLSQAGFNDAQVAYRAHILASTSKEEIIEKVIEDSADNYQKWFIAEKFFKSKRRGYDFFPSKPSLEDMEQELWKEYLGVDDALGVREQFQKLHLYRNALVHNSGEIREKDLRKAKVTFIQPQMVVLDENYVRHSFALIYCIVRHLSSTMI